MTRTLFRVLGTVHGIAGLLSMFLIAYLYIRSGSHTLAPGSGSAGLVGTVGGSSRILCLIACMVATWFRPVLASLFAWLAVIAFVTTGVLITALQSDSAGLSDLPTSFYYNALIRVAAALALSLLARRLFAVDNKSFKKSALSSFHSMVASVSSAVSGVSFDWVKVKEVFGKSSSALFVLQLLGLAGVVVGLRHGVDVFTGESLSEGGVAALVLPLLVMLKYAYIVRFVGAAGVVLGLVYLSSAPRSGVLSLVGVVGNLLLVAIAWWFLRG